MRILHAVADHEVFVGSGTYIYHQNGHDTGERESWTIHELKGGAYLIRVDVDCRFSERGGFSRLEEALYQPDGSLVRYNFYYADSSPDPLQELPNEVRADYTVMDDYIQIAYTAGQNDRVYEEVPLVESSVLSPHGFVFMGQVIQSTLAAGGKDVVVFDLDYHLYGSMAHPVRYTASFEKEETIQVGRKSISTRCYNFSRIDKPHDRLYWLDDHDIVVKFEHITADEHQTAILTNYAHR